MPYKNSGDRVRHYNVYDPCHTDADTMEQQGHGGLRAMSDLVEEASRTSLSTRPSRIGRRAAPPVELPDVRLAAAAIADYLKDRDGPQRRPEVTARILALAVLLYLDHRRPWPTRDQVKQHLDVSKPMIDVVISKGQALKDLKVLQATKRGNIKARDSITTQRFLRPSDQLVDIVQRVLDEDGKLQSFRLVEVKNPSQNPDNDPLMDKVVHIR